MGQLVFLPTAILVGTMNVAAGEAASAGQRPYQVTTGQRTVTAPLNPSLPPATAGESVSIILPSQTAGPGKIPAVSAGSPTPRPPTRTPSGATALGGDAPCREAPRR